MIIIQEYLRIDNESHLQHIIRVVNGKDTGLYDIDYTEIANLLFGMDLSSHEARKRYYGWKMLVSVIEEEGINNINEDELLNKIEQEKLELEKEKVKFQDQRREYKKIVRESARFENILEYIEKTAEEVSRLKPIVQKQKPTVRTTDKEGVLLLGDWHFGIETENFLNSFNKDVFTERINKLVSKTVEYGVRHGISKLHVVNLGDMVSGIIHVTSRIANSEDIITQVQYVAEVIAEMLVEFSNYFEANYYDVIDNHSRVSPNKKESIPKESFARFIPWYLQARLKDYSSINIIKNEYDEGISVFDVCGYTSFAVHGHLDSVKGSVSNLSLMLRIFPDYVFMGHFHHNVEDEIHSCEVIVNSTLSGTDDYAKDIRRSSKPSQKFMVFTKEDGRQCTYNINLK